MPCISAKMLFVALVLIADAGCGLVVASICPPGWQRYGGSCYFMMTQRMKWSDADRTCREMTAALAVPNSAGEQDYLWDLFLTTFDQNPQVSLWIGCNDIKEEGKWLHCPLQGGNQSLYANWKDRQPNNVGGADCGVMSLPGNGQWDDQSCGLLRHVVCEFPIQYSRPKFCLTTEDDGSVSHKCLMHHAVTVLPVRGIIPCGKACLAEPRCRSFNVLKRGSNIGDCQLNYATRLEAGEENLEEIQDCLFFDL